MEEEGRDYKFVLISNTDDTGPAAAAGQAGLRQLGKRVRDASGRDVPNEIEEIVLDDDDEQDGYVNTNNNNIPCNPFVDENCEADNPPKKKSRSSVPSDAEPAASPPNPSPSDLLPSPFDTNADDDDDDDILMGSDEENRVITMSNAQKDAKKGKRSLIV